MKMIFAMGREDTLRSRVGTAEGNRLNPEMETAPFRGPSNRRQATGGV
jgi:hypothetical protein